jgi:hypothetical protein
LAANTRAHTLPAAALAQRTYRPRLAVVTRVVPPPHASLHALTHRIPLCAHLPLRHFSLSRTRTKQNLIFRFLQSKQRIQIWLYENTDTRIEGRIIVRAPN